MSILVLGGTGFLGSAAALALRENNLEVKVLCRTRPAASFSKDAAIPIYTADFATLRADDSIFDGIDTILHFISATNPASSMQDMTFDVSANLMPTLNLLEIMKQRKILRLIYASSGGTIYGIPKKLPASEDDPANPICAHGITKLTIEKFILLHARLMNLTPIILRIGNPYGPYQLRGVTIGSIARFVHLHSMNKSIEVWGDGSVVRDYLYIDDFRDALAGIVAKRSFPGGIYNVGSGVGHSLLDVIAQIERVSQRKLARTFAHQRIIDVPAIVLDITRLRRALPAWQPRVPLSKGIQRMWADALKEAGLNRVPGAKTVKASDSLVRAAD
jgi:UDP-glucose 4-epimerase